MALAKGISNKAKAAIRNADRRPRRSRQMCHDGQPCGEAEMEVDVEVDAIVIALSSPV
jgi:hypothetical protein